MTTCLSKALSIMVSVEWGLGNIKFLSPYSFSADFDGKTFTFHACQTEHFNTMVDIPEFDEQLMLMLISNKRGDNLILMTHRDCKEVMGTSIDFEWIAPRIKKKMEIKVRAL